jgi:hypothetical protein
VGRWVAAVLTTGVGNAMRKPLGSVRRRAMNGRSNLRRAFFGGRINLCDLGIYDQPSAKHACEMNAILTSIRRLSHHVTRLLLVLGNVPADGVLVDGVVRQPHPEVAEDDHDQAGAVEGVGTGAAPLVGGAVVGGSFGYDGSPKLWARADDVDSEARARVTNRTRMTVAAQARMPGRRYAGTETPRAAPTDRWRSPHFQHTEVREAFPGQTHGSKPGQVISRSSRL